MPSLSASLIAEDVIKAIYEKGKENRGKRTDLTSGPIGPKVSPIEPTFKPHNTNKEIGKMIGMSRTQVTRMNNVGKFAYFGNISRVRA